MGARRTPNHPFVHSCVLFFLRFSFVGLHLAMKKRMDQLCWNHVWNMRWTVIRTFCPAKLVSYLNYFKRSVLIYLCLHSLSFGGATETPQLPTCYINTFLMLRIAEFSNPLSTQLEMRRDSGKIVLVLVLTYSICIQHPVHCYYLMWCSIFNEPHTW